MARVGKIKIAGSGGMKRKAMSFSMDKNWQKYNEATSVKRFKNKFARERRKALNLVAKKILKKAIQEGGFVKNAPLTVMIKGSSQPLSDTGSILSKAVKTKIINQKSIFVGVLSADKFYQQAVAIHEGTLLRVTPAMRAMFMMLWLVSTGKANSDDLTGRAKELWDRSGGGWAPLKASTSVIKIPSRPFMEKAFLSSEVRAYALNKFAEAVDDTIRQLAAGK